MSSKNRVGEIKSEFTAAHRKQTRLAIIGRPNVGKSTLFNFLTETRKAVVKDQPGVTRDILIEPAELWGNEYEVIDTGGLTEASDLISVLIREQVVEFLKSIDLLICVMDGRTGLIPEDRDIIRIAIETAKPFLIVVNKIDSVQNLEILKAEFYEFGKEVVSASFEQRHGMTEILEWISEHIKKFKALERDAFTIAIVGKPNVGKSSLVNCLVGENRVLVSTIAGTTVDTVDVELEYEGNKYVILDTAGLRKQAKRYEDVEIISAFKSRDAISRADLVLLVVDGTEGPTNQDTKILEQIIDEHKTVLMVANKTDLGADDIAAFHDAFEAQSEKTFHYYTDIPTVFVSALYGQGINDMFAKIEDLKVKMNFKIGTSQLNDFFMTAIRGAPSPVHNNDNVKFYYLTQTNQVPPSFIAFANHPESVSPQYRRYLSKRIKEEWGLQGLPIRIFVMKSRKR